MLTVSYHTDSPGYLPRHRAVYHDRDDCVIGEQIRPEHRKPGTGLRPRCSECIAMDKAPDPVGAGQTSLW